MLFAILIPDWNSLDSVRHAHSFLEAAALVFFALLVLFDVLAHLSEDKKRERLLEKIGLCFFAVAVFAEITAYPYGQRNDILSEQLIGSLDKKAQMAAKNLASINKAMEWRTKTFDADKFTASMSGVKPVTLDTEYIPGENGEPFSLAVTIMLAFEKVTGGPSGTRNGKKWNVYFPAEFKDDPKNPPFPSENDPRITAFLSPPFGVTLFAADLSPDSPVRRLSRALREAGLEKVHTWRTARKMPEDTLVVVVGRKPPEDK